MSGKLGTLGRPRERIATVTASPVEGGLVAVHPGLQLQAGELGEGRDDEGEDEGQAHEDGGKDHLWGGGTQ